VIHGGNWKGALGSVLLELQLDVQQNSCLNANSYIPLLSEKSLVLNKIFSNVENKEFKSLIGTKQLKLFHFYMLVKEITYI
jgi:hypothetical protein